MVLPPVIMVVTMPLPLAATPAAPVIVLTMVLESVVMVVTVRLAAELALAPTEDRTEVAAAAVEPTETPAALAEAMAVSD